MSVLMYENKVNSINNEIIRLRNEQNKYLKKANDSASNIQKARELIGRTKSNSTIKMKFNEIDRETKKQIEANKKYNEFSKKIAIKEKELRNTEKNLNKELSKEKQRFEISINQNLSTINARQIQVENEINILKRPKDKITILFIASDTLNPQDSKLNLDKEAREISEAIIKTKERDSINFETRWATKVSDLFRIINETTPTIIHFSGHGTNNDELVFLDNNDNLKSVGLDTIVKMVNASCDDTRLIVFNNCFSALIAEKITEKVEAAIGMNNAIGDNAAIVFASHLYSAIGSGLSLEKAFKQAIIQLEFLDIPKETTPQLYVNSSFSANDIFFVNKG